MNRPLLVFGITFLISIVLHILIVLAIYYPSNFISMPLTGGMLLGWLFSSSTVKDHAGTGKDINFYKALFSGLPSVLKYTLGFLAVYTIVNFIVVLSFKQGSGWFDFDLSHNKLRGISGFWLFFYALGFSSAYFKLQQSK